MKSMQPSLKAIRNASDNSGMVDAANKLAATFDHRRSEALAGFREFHRAESRATSPDRAAGLEGLANQRGRAAFRFRFVGCRHLGRHSRLVSYSIVDE
jgi:hypothetical protein